jgi:hypothetical protein
VAGGAGWCRRRVPPRLTPFPGGARLDLVGLGAGRAWIRRGLEPTVRGSGRRIWVRSTQLVALSAIFASKRDRNQFLHPKLGSEGRGAESPHCAKR